MKLGKKKQGTRSNSRASQVERSGGSVFADLGLPQPEQYLARAELAERVCDIISERKLTQQQAAATLGIDQPKISALMRGKLDGFSTDRLFRFLNALGRDVEIVIRSTSRSKHTAGIRVLSSRAS